MLRLTDIFLFVHEIMFTLFYVYFSEVTVYCTILTSRNVFLGHISKSTKNCATKKWKNLQHLSVSNLNLHL